MREQMIWNGYEDRLVEKSVKNDEKSEKNGNKISRVWSLILIAMKQNEKHKSN